jgi:hypothetical protein
LKFTVFYLREAALGHPDPDLKSEISTVSFNTVVDSLGLGCYNYDMMKTKRTARKDSNFVIYEAIAPTGDSYIGLTRKGTVVANKAVKERWRKHISRARHEDREWALYQFIRAGNWDGWTHKIITIIRGRAEAYAYERELVKMAQPTLNDQYL